MPQREPPSDVADRGTLRAVGGQRMRWMTLLAAGLLIGLATVARAQSCDVLGGDADGDGICDDGSGSGVVGDLPCSCQPPFPPGCLENCDDNCAFAPNPDQLDVGRVGDPDLPDGIGDSCQCLDVSDDGVGNVLDGVLLRRSVELLPPPLPAPEKCAGSVPPRCEASDADLLRHKLADPSFSPSLDCLAAGGCWVDTLCPAGSGCNLDAQRCAKLAGQACVQADQCLSDACCSEVCRDLASDVANCGSCGTACTNPNGTTACDGGACVPSCSPGFGSCDEDPVNGCEQPLNTLADCGACDAPCDLAHATESCSTGTCHIDDCASGFANCDGSEETGCELRNDGVSNTYPGEFLGSIDADIYAGFLCPTVPCHYVTDRQYPTGRYFYVTAHESSTCSAQLRLRFHLDVPPGVAFGVQIYAPAGCSCAPSSCHSSNGAGEPADVLVACPDDPFSDDSANLDVRVYWDGGSSCLPWKLTVSAGSCS